MNMQDPNKSGIEILEKLRVQKEQAAAAASSAASRGSDSPNPIAQAQAVAAVKQAEQMLGSAMELVESMEEPPKDGGAADKGA